MNYISRQKKLIKLLDTNSLDAFLVRKKQNISYLIGAEGEGAVLFISHKGNFLITKAKYEEDYTKSIKNCKLVIAEDKNFCSYIDKLSKNKRSKRIGFESNGFLHSEYADLKKKLKQRILIPTKDLVESLRIIKDSDEINYIKTACKNTSNIMNYALEIVRSSVSEISVKNKIEAYIAKKRLKRADFDIIVASGVHSSMPHATILQKNIKKGEMVIIDLGTMNHGYNSDLTRTVFLGRIEHKYLRIYNIVLDAQKIAIENIKPGTPARYIDNISRQYIRDKGLEKYFIHGLGHGIGLEIHEKPYLSQKSTIVLEKNMAMTVEPGVYIPGWGGIRIEDDILLTKDGCEVLTKSCKKTLCR